MRARPEQSDSSIHWREILGNNAMTQPASVDPAINDFFVYQLKKKSIGDIFSKIT